MVTKPLKGKQEGIEKIIQHSLKIRDCEFLELLTIGTEKYIEELIIHRPELFLNNSGGNDFAGFNQLVVIMKGEGKFEHSYYSLVHEIHRQKKKASDNLKTT